MDTVVDDFVSFLQAVTSGSRISHVALIVFVLIGLAWITAGLMYRRILNERRHTTSKATQENFETTAAELRARALKMKQGDDELWKHEPEVTWREKPEALLKDTGAESRPKREQSTQQHVFFKERQRILKQSVGRTITIGFKDHQDNLLQSNLKELLPATQRKRKKAA